MPHPSHVCRGRVGILTSVQVIATSEMRIVTSCRIPRPSWGTPGKRQDGLPYFLPIFSRNRFSCSSVQYPQSSRINTDVYGIVSVLFSTST